MTARTLKNSLFISLLGHAALFAVFSFSFGNMPPRAEYGRVVFLGALLRVADVLPPQRPTAALSRSLQRAAIGKSLSASGQGSLFVLNAYVKPLLPFASDSPKQTFVPAMAEAAPPMRKESSIMFYPQLPYQFLLYFKDRQEAHIELAFNIVSAGEAHSILIKRKVSSGNLEADLLSMRYIDRYLFIQQSRFPSNTWQTVRIDLRPKSE